MGKMFFTLRCVTVIILFVVLTTLAMSITDCKFANANYSLLFSIPKEQLFL